MCVRKCPLLTSEFAKKPELLWSKGAPSHGAVGERNGIHCTGSLGPPMLVGGKVDEAALRPLARLLRNQPVGVALRPFCPPRPPHIWTVHTMGRTGVPRGHAHKHGSLPVLPRKSADIGDTKVLAGLGPDPHHHGGPGMLTPTTVTSTCTTPCHLLRNPRSSVGQPMAISPHTTVQPHPPIHTNLSPPYAGTQSSPLAGKQTD